SDLTRSVLALGGVRVTGHGATAVPVRGLQGCSSVRFGLTLPAVEVVEGPQDVAHQPVAYYVFVAEINEMDLGNLGQDLLDLDQARGLRIAQVDLRNVTGDGSTRMRAQAREEHLHLTHGRVLRLVENDERVVQRAPAHESERRDLDHAQLHEAADLL